MKGPAGPLSDTSSLAELARNPVVDEVQMKVFPAASNAAGASWRMSDDDVEERHLKVLLKPYFHKP